MSLLSWPSLPASLLLLLLSSLCRLQAALIVTPSTKWYGDDGSWSTVSIRIGSPQQWLDVLVNTQSSETWVVGTGGCEEQNPICVSSRGGTFDSTNSSSWKPLGFYELGINTELGDSEYADYGLDSLTFGSTGVTTAASIIGIVNATDSTWLGSFGLGIVQGSFDNKTPLSAISALVERDGVIQSHSYAYTAGARYQQKGIPTSLTLGGYDASRFIPHQVSFSLNSRSQAEAYIDSISVVSAVESNNWTTGTQILVSADRVSAIIDSSTPYLWLPRVVCERFAATLGLTYNATLNLYTFASNNPQLAALRNAQLSFTFSLSDLGSSTERVNITLPYDAFDLQLTFPAIPNTTFGSSEASKNYFPLKQATDENQYRIGRSFLQEAYLITDYERNNFSIHQAVHTANPLSDFIIVDISRANLTTLSGPPSGPPTKTISTGAIVGIVIGSLSVLAVLCGLVIFCRRTRRATPSPLTEKPPPSKKSILSRLFGRGRGTSVHEAHGNSDYATEIGADASHERFELAAPPDPVELDSESCTADWTTENGSSQNSERLSAYEQFRRKLERQQAASHASQTVDGHLNAEKLEHDPSQVAHYRASEVEDVASPPVSPPLVSPLEGESGRSMSPPSPLTPRLLSHPNSEPPTYRGIDPANVLYLGRLPSNVQLPNNIPRVVRRDGNEASNSTVSDPSDLAVSFPAGDHSTNHQELASLDAHGRDRYRNPAISPVSNESDSATGSHNIGRDGVVTPETDGAVSRRLPTSAYNQQRLDGEDLVHVPQPAENRFSWEEERIPGIEKPR